ncbi:MAG: GntR family transcriptional regulator [Sphingomonadaceae bacterium]
MLDERSPVPLYYQLQEIIRSRIESGQWGPGQQLPPEAELCEEFNLSRGTVRQALADLVREGLLHRRRGKGSFVATPKIPQDLLRVATGFSEYAKQVIGTELGSRLIEVTTIPANRSLARRFELAEGDELYEIRKVKLAHERPYFMSTSYVPKAVCPDLDKEDHSTGSLFQLLRQKYGIAVTKVEGWFEPILVNEYEASVLDLPKGAPAMLYERMRYTASNRPVMLNKHIIRGDMCRLTFQLSDSSN